MNVTRMGLDIAKQVFQVHGVDEHDEVVLRKTLKRAQVLTFFANLPPVGSAWKPAAVRTMGRGS